MLVFHKISNVIYYYCYLEPRHKVSEKWSKEPVKERKIILIWSKGFKLQTTEEKVTKTKQNEFFFFRSSLFGILRERNMITTAKLKRTRQNNKCITNIWNCYCTWLWQIFSFSLSLHSRSQPQWVFSLYLFEYYVHFGRFQNWIKRIFLSDRVKKKEKKESLK